MAHNSKKIHKSPSGTVFIVEDSDHLAQRALDQLGGIEFLESNISDPDSSCHDDTVITSPFWATKIVVLYGAAESRVGRRA